MKNHKNQNIMKNLMKSSIAQITLMIIISITGIQAQKLNDIKINVLPSKKGIQLSYEKMLNNRTSYAISIGHKSSSIKHDAPGSQNVYESSTRFFIFLGTQNGDNTTPRRVVHNYQSSVVDFNLVRYSKAISDKSVQGRIVLNVGLGIESLKYSSIDYTYKELSSENFSFPDYGWVFSSSDQSFRETRKAFNENKVLLNANLGVGYQLIFNNLITLDFTSDFRMRTKKFRDANKNRYEGTGHFNAVQMIPGMKLGVRF